MRGLEYLCLEHWVAWWEELDSLVRQQANVSASSAREFLYQLHPAWRTVGRVTVHLAENRGDPESPFAFLATYATRLSAQGKAQHLPLGRALKEYAGTRNRASLLALLQPIQQAAILCLGERTGGLGRNLSAAGLDAARSLSILAVHSGA